MSQIEFSEVLVEKEDWENFLASLERLMALHKRTIEKLREVKSRNRALRTELRSAMELPTAKQPRKGNKELLVTKAVKTCVNCGNELEGLPAFCDRCGEAVFKCECGRELGQDDRFCDICGRPVSSRGTESASLGPL